MRRRLWSERGSWICRYFMGVNYRMEALYFFQGKHTLFQLEFVTLLLQGRLRMQSWVEYNLRISSKIAEIFWLSAVFLVLFAFATHLSERGLTWTVLVQYHFTVLPVPKLGNVLFVERFVYFNILHATTLLSLLKCRDSGILSQNDVIHKPAESVLTEFVKYEPSTHLRRKKDYTSSTVVYS